MTDKELYRYLQRIKFILNDSKGTKEENKKAIYNLKDQLESLKINCNIYFFEYKLFRMKVLFFSIITLGIYKKSQKSEIDEQNELLYKSLESFDEEYKKVEEEIHKLENENIDIDTKINRYSNEYERINSYFGR